jgi:hypothetical protein
MNKALIEDHVLPRPVERLPDYAHAKSRQTLADRLVDAFSMSHSSATAIANAVVDPSEVRKAIGEPSDPEIEKIAVPGGTLLGIRTTVWVRRVMPDPRNPRTLPSRRHPFAVDPGSAGEESKFRPLPEPKSCDPMAPQTAELAVEIENRHHLNWACQQAANYVLAENDWRKSIESQGVMEAVWLVATTFRHGDGFPPVTTLVTAEGSSRITAEHDLLTIRSADVPYDDSEAKLRAHIRKLNDIYEKGAGPAEMIQLRCERVPALILVGFRPHTAGTTGFATAVKSLVALRHVDPPKPWGEGPENESLADEVLDELYRRGLISETEQEYYAGSYTRAEARAARLSDDPAVRAAQIVRLFTSTDERVVEAIRVAITSQSTRKRVTQKLSNDLATALILRAIDSGRADADQIRRYLRYAFGTAVHRAEWKATNRDNDQLIKDALVEVRESLSKETLEDPGPASLELAVRAAYPLVTKGRLNADRGSAGNAQPDRRNPGEVLDAMRRTLGGVHQLGQALKDFVDDRSIRAVDEDGIVKRQEGDGGEQMVNDIYLRGEFPAPGKARAPRPGDTPDDRYRSRLAALAAAVEGVEQTFVELTKVTGNDGRALVEARGVDPRDCTAWRDVLRTVDEELVVWSRTFRRVYGAEIPPAHEDTDDSDDGDAGDDGFDEEIDSDDASVTTTPMN